MCPSPGALLRWARGTKKQKKRRRGGSWNSNVRLALIFSFLSSAARGVWAFTILSIYLKDLAKTSTAVGGAEGIQGIAQAILAVGAGIVADRVRRDTVLHFAGLVGLIACGMMIYALSVSDEMMEDMERYWFMTAALGAMGCFQGMSSTCIDTLFADSVRTGQRSKFNTFRFVLTQISSVTGPIICVFLFLHFGNEWTRKRLTIVFMVGVCLNIVPVMFLFCMSDDHTLGLDSESHHIPSTPGGTTRYQRLVDEVLEVQRSGEDYDPIQASPYAPLRIGENNAVRPETTGRRYRTQSLDDGDAERLDMLNEPLVARGSRPRVFQGEAWEEEGRLNERINRQVSGVSWFSMPKCLCFGQEHIAGLLIASDVISALGSGMSVKFFPLFFKSKLGMTPISLNSVYIALPVFMTLVSIGARRWAQGSGRVQVCVWLSVLSTLGLFGLGYTGSNKEHHQLEIILPIYFLSTLQHCTRPLRKAVLMDFVPKAQRARYNSVESITRLNWSGSAVLGGMSIDKHGFGHLFFTTAMLQLASVLFLVLLIPLVPIKESERRGENGALEHREEESEGGAEITNDHTLDQAALVQVVEDERERALVETMIDDDSPF